LGKFQSVDNNCTSPPLFHGFVLLQIDALCVNWNAWERSEARLNRLEVLMRRIRKVVIVLQPVSQPIIFSRAWCIFEMFCAQKHSLPVSLTVREEQKRSSLCYNNDIVVMFVSYFLLIIIRC
jgi:hypothetical protein